MTNSDVRTAPTPAATTPVEHHQEPVEAAAVAAANPGMIGLPAFLVGSIALGLSLVGYAPATAGGSIVAIIIAATGVGQLTASIWAIREGQAAVASVFGIFAGFWLSYAFLVLGLTHSWYGNSAATAATDAVAAQKLFLLSWLITIALLTVASLRLPLAFSVLFALVALALLLVFLGTTSSSTSLTQAGGYVVFAFVLVGVYLFVDAFSVATGGKTLPLGNPLLK